MAVNIYPNLEGKFHPSLAFISFLTQTSCRLVFQRPGAVLSTPNVSAPGGPATNRKEFPVGSLTERAKFRSLSFHESSMSQPATKPDARPTDMTSPAGSTLVFFFRSLWFFFFRCFHFTWFDALISPHLQRNPLRCTAHPLNNKPVERPSNKSDAEPHRPNAFTDVTVDGRTADQQNGLPPTSAALRFLLGTNSGRAPNSISTTWTKGTAVGYRSHGWALGFRLSREKRKEKETSTTFFVGSFCSTNG